MKKKFNLYKDMLEYKNILSIAYDVLRKNRNKNKSLEFRKNLNINLIDIKNKLANNNYTFSKYKIFMIKAPKYRIIMSESVDDKIVNHLVSRYILLPSIEKCNIDTNVATRIGKGSRYVFEYFCKYIRQIGTNKKIYILKMDISKYFYNIDHDILLDKVNSKIKDKEALNIIQNILNTTNYDYINERIKSLIDHEITVVNNLNISNKEKEIETLINIPKYNKGKGLPIGNMKKVIDVYANMTGQTRKEVMSNQNDIGWTEYRDIINVGDTDYLNHAFSWMGKENNISVIKNDNTIVDLTISNNLQVNKTY